MRIADVLNRRPAPAVSTVRVARNRWSDLESAPADGWRPQRGATVIHVAASSLAAAQAEAERSAADVLVLSDEDQAPDAETVAALSWWQHICDYAVSVAPGPENDAGDWLASYQRESEQLNRAGYEAFRGATAGLLAVPRSMFELAGGIDPGAGESWQLDLAYRLAQRGAVFVLAPDVTAPRPVAPADLVEACESIPLLPERRRDWGRRHRVPAVHVVVDCATAPEAAVMTIEGVLDGEYRDLIVSVVGWSSKSEPLTDDRVEVCAVPPASFPVPFRLELPAGCVLQPYSIRRMLNRMRESQVGLYQAIVEPTDEVTSRSLAVRLLRSAAIERSLRANVEAEHLDDAIDEMFGSTWVDGRRFGLRHFADAPDAVYRDIEDESDGVTDEEEPDEDDD